MALVLTFNAGLTTLAGFSGLKGFVGLTTFFVGLTTLTGLTFLTDLIGLENLITLGAFLTGFTCLIFLEALTGTAFLRGKGRLMLLFFLGVNATLALVFGLETLTDLTTFLIFFLTILAIASKEF
ncbi:MAG: hypothetical protein SH807_08970 [Blastochloris sp.]|nr:hypothetical protein [Blastochloris sp.]